MESRVWHDREEIDLRLYIRALIRRWPLLLVFVVVAAAGGFLYGTWQERNPMYRAAALVAMGKARYVLNLDTRVQTPQLTQTSVTASSLTTLATSDGLLGQLLAEVNQAFPNEGLTLETLRPMLTATASTDAQLVTLEVRGEVSTLVTAVANAWAEVFAAEAQRFYGLSEVLSLFEAQVARAKDELALARQNRIAFKAQDTFAALETEYNALKSAHRQYLDEKLRIQALLQDVGLLQAQLEAQANTQPMTATLSAENQAALLSLVLKSQDANVKTTISAGIGGVNVDPRRSLEQGLAVLAALRGDLQTKLAYLDTQIADVLPLLTSLQERMEISRAKEKEVDAAVTAAEEAYNLVRRGLESARINDADTANRARVARSAAVPTSPIQPRRRLQYTLLAATLGLMAGVMMAFLLEYLRGGQSQPETDGSA